MIAPLLDLDEGARAAFEAGNKMRCGLAHGHDVVHRDRRLIFGIGPGLAAQLLDIADDPVDLLHRRIPFGIELGRATRDHDPRTGLFAAGAADGLAHLALRFGSDRAAVDDDRFGEAGSRRMLPHHLGLEGVQAATESQDPGTGHDQAPVS